MEAKIWYRSDLKDQTYVVISRVIMQSWQMQTAKARFSELVKHAAQEGPQEITLHGRSVAVVVSRELFDRLSGNEQSLVDFMRSSPLAGHDEITFERNRSLPREITF
jgi:prevent-host-death family protein